MDALIFIFAFFSGLGLLGMAFTRDEPRRGNQLVSLNELVTTRKLCMYAFLIFFLLTALQINVTFGGLQLQTTTYAAYNVITNTMVNGVPTTNSIQQYPAYSVTQVQNQLPSNLTTGTLLVYIAASFLAIAMLADLISIFAFLVTWMNNRR